MKYSYVFAALAASVSAHGVITQVQGANKVVMPGLSVADGTPRDSPSPASGAEADTSIIRAREMTSGKASALGRTSSGPVDASAAIAMFMGGAAPANTKRAPQKAAATKGQKTASGAVEGGVSKAAGQGASAGLPTCSDAGVISMTFHQVNQDGAGPLTAQIDPTSAGTDPAAFQDAKVTQNVPGIGIGGLSAAQTTDFPVKVQMPAGMTCSGSAGGANNVCVVRLQNAALAGPFGGSAAFTMSAGAKKRAVEYNLRKLKTRSVGAKN